MRTVPEELLWILGGRAVRDFRALPVASPEQSSAFPDAGIHVLRDRDLYLLFNASDCGLNGRGSHGHNDALSIEVSAGGSAFIVDPGSYVYTADLRERHLFRSTAYHSTVQIDGVEQNTIEESAPFVIGNEANPRVTAWESNAELDLIVAEHDGYQRLTQPVTHRRTVRFDKKNRLWLIQDEFTGAGTHELVTRFHFDAGLDVTKYDRTAALALDRKTGAQLLVLPLDEERQPQFEDQFTSRDYGEKQASISACWLVEAAVPFKLRWLLLPIWARENDKERLALVNALKHSTS
jgi:uncharacterized heparinase superfamily protein